MFRIPVLIQHSWGLVYSPLLVVGLFGVTSPTLRGIKGIISEPFTPTQALSKIWIGWVRWCGGLLFLDFFGFGLGIGSRGTGIGA